MSSQQNTGRVDVLAVMDEMKEQVIFGAMTIGQGQDADLLTLLNQAEEARAAVAELIEAAKGVMDCPEFEEISCDGSMAPCEDAIGKLETALARIGATP